MSLALQPPPKQKNQTTSMKTPIAVTLIIVGGLLILAPVFSGERQKERVASFYKDNGNAATLPEAMRPWGAYDWACLAAGSVLAFAGVRQSVRFHGTNPA